MAEIELRAAFALFLEKLAGDQTENRDWSRYVVAQYPDEELEEIRRELVRLAIKRSRVGAPIWERSDRLQFVHWANALRDHPVP